MRKRAAPPPEITSENDEQFYVHHSPGAIALFMVVFLFFLGAFAYLFWGYVTDFILAFMFTALFRDVYESLRVRLGDRPLVASALVTFLIAVLVAIPAGFIVVSLTVEAANFYNSTISMLTVDEIELYFFGEGPLALFLRHGAEMANVEWTPALVQDALTSVSGSVAEIVYGLVSSQLSNLFLLLMHFFIMLLIVFYMLIDGQRLKSYIFETSPLPDDEEELLAQKFAAVGRATLFGNGFGSVAQGVIGAITMVVAGLPSPVLWGVVMTIFAFLPLVGITVVTIPASIYLILNGKYLTAALFFGFNFAQALFVENVVKTKMIGQQMKMHSLLIFMSIIAGLGLFGVIGLLYGPLVVALVLTLAELYHKRYKGHVLRRAIPVPVEGSLDASAASAPGIVLEDRPTQEVDGPPEVTPEDRVTRQVDIVPQEAADVPGDSKTGEGA